MAYLLKLFDDNLLKFEINKTIDDIEIKILWINNGETDMLPIGMKAENDSVKKWLKARMIPFNRAYAQNFLSKL